MGNKSGILKIFQNTDKVESISFDPLRHLKKCDAIYYKVEMYNELNQPKSYNSDLNIKSIASYAVLPDSLRTEETNNDNSQISLQEKSLALNKNSKSCNSIRHFRTIRSNSSCFNNRILNPIISINNRSKLKRSHHFSTSSSVATLYHNSSFNDHLTLNNDLNHERKIGFAGTEMRASCSEESLPLLNQRIEI